MGRVYFELAIHRGNYVLSLHVGHACIWAEVLDEETLATATTKSHELMAPFKSAGLHVDIEEEDECP